MDAGYGLSESCAERSLQEEEVQEGKREERAGDGERQHLTGREHRTGCWPARQTYPGSCEEGCNQCHIKDDRDQAVTQGGDRLARSCNAGCSWILWCGRGGGGGGSGSGGPGIIEAGDLFLANEAGSAFAGVL